MAISTKTTTILALLGLLLFSIRKKAKNSIIRPDEEVQRGFHISITDPSE